MNAREAGACAGHDAATELTSLIGRTVANTVSALDADRKRMADFIEASIQGSQVVRRVDGEWYVIL